MSPMYSSASGIDPGVWKASGPSWHNGLKNPPEISPPANPSDQFAAKVPCNLPGEQTEWLRSAAKPRCRFKDVVRPMLVAYI